MNKFSKHLQQEEKEFTYISVTAYKNPYHGYKLLESPSFPQSSYGRGWGPHPDGKGKELGSLLGGENHSQTVLYLKAVFITKENDEGKGGILVKDYRLPSAKS